jgi:hypothetical protein
MEKMAARYSLLALKFHHSYQILVPIDENDPLERRLYWGHPFSCFTGNRRSRCCAQNLKITKNVLEDTCLVGNR